MAVIVFFAATLQGALKPHIIVCSVAVFPLSSFTIANTPSRHIATPLSICNSRAEENRMKPELPVHLVASVGSPQACFARPAADNFCTMGPSPIWC
jgi:hypothetical protein